MKKNLLLALCFVLISCNIGYAQPQSDKLIKQGIANYRAENYDEALVIFKKLRKIDPASSLAAYYLGLTYKRLQNYIDAKTHLEVSLHMRPKIKGALVELIDILYRLDEIEEAKKWIKVAEDEGVRPAQAAFLKGLTLLKNAEYEEAISSFKDAKDLDPDYTQSADYQLGIAYLRLKRFSDARDAFRDLVVLDPHTDIAAYAERYIEAIDRKIEKEKPFHMSLRFAFEHDSNVLLKPSDTALVTGITDEDDTRQVWDLKGDYTFRSQDNIFSLKTGYGFHISKQNDFGRYDVISNNFNAQPSISLEKMLMTFPVNYSHSIVDEKNYLSAIAAGNVNNFLLGDSYMGQLGMVYKYKDYLRPTFINEDRTGDELMGVVGLFWFFLKREGFLGVRYSCNKDWTDGDNWEYTGHKATATFLLPFLEKFKFNVNGEIFLQDYDNTHTIFNVKREDKVYTISTSLSYEIIENVELQFKYIHVDNQSNIGLYDYERDIISGAIQYKF